MLDEAEHWDEVTRASCSSASSRCPPIRFFTARRGGHARRASATWSWPRTASRKIPVLNMVDAKLFAGQLDGFRFAGHARRPRDLAAGGARASTPRRASTAPTTSRARPRRSSTTVVDAFAHGELHGQVWDELAAEPRLERGDARGAQRLLLAPVGVERDRLRRPGLSARLRPLRRRASARAGRARPRSSATRSRTHTSAGGPVRSERPRAAHAARGARCARRRTTRRSCSTSTAARSRTSAWPATTTATRSIW